ncbi:hypothetical protein MNAN1_003459 [Malassezia nana]|uniref:Inhibitor of growth protein N-terminal histone-binding domain-containing protein n=1 Tax=Malassezia nana TaxID=180528 RepID=A0AAF0J4U5_9BASI|nr:hypothetical protein MNAN1_003459 [Malassezia nana]
MARRKRMQRTRSAADAEDEKAPVPLSDAELEQFHAKIQDRTDRWAEEYSEIVDQLPLELQRTFSLMKELDQNSEDIKQKVNETWHQYSDAREEDTDASHRNSQLLSIRDHTQQVVSLAEEKLALALSAYDLVDRQIRRLDTDLLKIEKSLCAQLRKEQMDALHPGSSSDYTPVPSEDDRISPQGQELSFWSGLISLDPLTCLGYLREHLQTNAAEPVGKKRKNSAHEKEKEAPSALKPPVPMDYDPSEPRYCYCDCVSYGEVGGVSHTHRWWLAKTMTVRANGCVPWD